MFFLGFLSVAAITSAFEFPSLESGFVDAINFIFGAETSVALLKFGLFLVFLALMGHVTLRYVFPDNTSVAIIVSLILAFFSVRFFPQNYLDAVKEWWSILIVGIMVLAMLILPFTIAEWISPGNKRMRWVFYVLIIGLIIYGGNYAYTNDMIATPYLEDAVQFIGENLIFVIGGAVLAFLGIKWIMSPTSEKTAVQLDREKENRQIAQNDKRLKTELAAADKRQRMGLMHDTWKGLVGWALGRKK